MRPSAPKQDLEVCDPFGMFMFKAGCTYTLENQSHVGGGESDCRKGKGQGVSHWLSCRGQRNSVLHTCLL